MARAGPSSFNKLWESYGKEKNEMDKIYAWFYMGLHCGAQLISTGLWSIFCDESYTSHEHEGSWGHKKCEYSSFHINVSGEQDVRIGIRVKGSWIKLYLGNRNTRSNGI